MRLRPFQTDWVRRIRKAMRGHRRVLCVGATGCGKTVVAAHIIRGLVKQGLRVLFLTHRKELVEQALNRLQARGVTSVGIIMADVPEDRSQPVQVASIQTLIHRKLPPADVIVVDEAHHAKARTWIGTLNKYPGVAVLGLTATPVRGDGAPLGDVFEDMVEAPSAETLIALGFLARPRCYSWGSPDLRDVELKNGDYESEELGRRMSDPKLVGDVVLHWEQYAKGRPSVCYAVNVAHAVALTERFQAAGARAELLTGETPKDQRGEMLEALEAGRIDIVVNVMVLTEGWDAPKVRNCILCRPTLSEGLFLQMVGRIMRPGDRPNILDHAGNVVRHGRPEQDWHWRLTEKRAKKAKHGARDTATKVCEGCGSNVSVACRECPGCGFEFWEKDGEVPEDVTQWLQEVTGPSLRERAMEMMKGNLNNSEIGRRLGVSNVTVSNWRKKEGLYSSIKTRTGKRKFDSSKASEAIAMIRSGSTNKEVARKLGGNDSTFAAIRRRIGFPPKSRGKQPLPRENAIRLLAAGASNYETARRLSIDTSTVRRWRREAGIRPIPVGGRGSNSNQEAAE